MGGDKSTQSIPLDMSLCSFDEVDWKNLHDEAGNVLPGIRGKSGAFGLSYYKEPIGCDLIELQPGAAFPLHTHIGDHILYVLSGHGTVTIGEALHHLDAEKHQSIFIAAHLPHNIGTYPDSKEPFTISAVSHPQKEVSATDRMRIVEE